MDETHMFFPLLDWQGNRMGITHIDDTRYIENNPTTFKHFLSIWLILELEQGGIVQVHCTIYMKSQGKVIYTFGYSKFKFALFPFL